VNQENPTAFEPNNQILAASLECLDRLPHELGCDLLRLVGPREARVCDLDVLERLSDEDGLEAGPNRLDLWELRHGLSVPVRRRV